MICLSMHGRSFLENLPTGLYCFAFFFFFLNRSIFSLSESSLFSFELLMCPCYLGLCQTWLLEIVCTLYS